MDWMFIVDIVFYAVVGLLVCPLFVLAVALLGGMTFDRAYEAVKAFLAKWTAIQPQDFLDKVFKTSGVATVVFLLGFGAYLGNRIGDAALPHTAAAFAYFGSKQVRWSIEAQKEWNEVKQRFRDVTGIGPDRIKWEEAKVNLGRYDIRFFRTMTVAFFIVSVSAIVALFRKASRRGAVNVLVASVLMLIMSHWLWVEREQQYVENLVSRYIGDYMKAHDGKVPESPATYPGRWPRSSP